MGPVEHEGDGLLKGEFIDCLKPLTQWNKTIYYCRYFEIYHCNTGRLVSYEDMFSWRTNKATLNSKYYIDKKRPSNRNRSESVNRTEAEHYILGNFEITIDGRISVFWKKLTKRNMLKIGSGFILDDILFLTKNTSDQTYADPTIFYDRLKQLPIWNTTTYYCVNTRLIKCEPDDDRTIYNRKSSTHQYNISSNIAEEIGNQLNTVRKHIATQFTRVDVAGMGSFAKTTGRFLRVFLETAGTLLIRGSIGCWNMLERFWIRMIRSRISSKRKGSGSGRG